MAMTTVMVGLEFPVGMTLKQAIEIAETHLNANQAYTEDDWTTTAGTKAAAVMMDLDDSIGAYSATVDGVQITIEMA